LAVFQQLDRDRIRAGSLVVFQVFQRPFYILTAPQIIVNSIFSQVDVLVTPIRSLRSSVPQNVLSIPPALGF
jgi:hypothetical protein